MATNKDSKIILAHDIRLDRDHRNILSYTEEQMLSLVQSKAVLSRTGYTFVRPDQNIIDVNASYGECLKSDYIAFQNYYYSGKWFFAFVDEVEYRNDGMTRIHFTIDVFATWWDYWTPKACFVVREHTNDDTIGANTVPEGLETGEYQILDLRNTPMFEGGDSHPDFYTCVVVSELLKDGSGNEIDHIQGEGSTIGGVFSALHYLVVNTETMARRLIEAYTKETKQSSIINVYPVPRNCVNINVSTGSVATGGNPTVLKGGDVTATVYPLYDSYTTGSYQLQQPNVLAGGYTPKNKKLYTYPFSYFYVTNKAGSDVVYRWEDFPFVNIDGYNARTCTYKKAFVPSTSISGRLYFTNYKGHAEDTSYGSRLYNYGINFPKVPVCAWTTDYFTNWLTQNGVNMATSIGTGAIGGAITGAGAGGVGGAIAGAVGGIISPIIGSATQTYNASRLPDQAHGDVNTGDVMFAYTKASISFYMMSIRPEFARIIDDVFTREGYKTNRVKVPNQTGRPYWNYVQIGESEDIGYSTKDISVPPRAMEEINSAYRRGVTIWHNHDNIGDYSLNNSL